MKRMILLVVVSLAFGFAVARFIPATVDLEAPQVAGGQQEHNGPRSALESRLDDLERALAEERQARQLLQEELMFLTEEVETLREGGSGMPAALQAPEQAAAATVREPFRQRYGRGATSEDRVQRLVAAGFSPDRAESIVQRESQSRMAILEARYEAARSGDLDLLEQTRYDQTNLFRDELGPSEYERYLEATGRPTDVLVGQVMDTSPAQRVGLQPGDRITRYDGTRIYNFADLNRATLQGQPGETVVAEFTRDGVTMQVAVRRGPLGITRSGRRR